MTRGKKVLVAKDQIVQSANHDFASITLVPTVVMIHVLPSSIDQSWYCGKPYVYIKITATKPSSAIRNSVEIERALIKKFGTKENIPAIIIIYTDGGPEHCTYFLSVKIAIISLQKSLNSDMIIALRTAPGYSFKNPEEKVNCILNLGLYGMGLMHKNMYQSPDANRTVYQAGGSFSPKILKKTLNC